MELLQKKGQLREIIRNSLIPLIDNDYIFIDLPYYKNIGDILIWNGTEAFLKEIKKKCLYRASFYTFDYRQLSSSAIIIMQGGGNWGDLWHEHNDFRKEIIKRYPQNKIIILPQTIYYEDDNNLKNDFECFSHHEKLIVCARDKYSYDIINKNLNTQVLLLPDMAFFLDITIKRKITGRSLFFKRNDKELNTNISYNIVPKNAEVSDWPTYEKKVFIDKCLARLQYWISHFYPQFSFSKCHRFENFIYFHILRFVYQNAGIKLLCNYDIIFSTRLHAAILGVLLGKEVVFFDNSYGKNSNFYHSWLEDLDNITLVEIK